MDRVVGERRVGRSRFAPAKAVGSGMGIITPAPVPTRDLPRSVFGYFIRVEKRKISPPIGHQSMRYDIS
jgi:hypothetical protein